MTRATQSSSDYQSTACILCSLNCGIKVKTSDDGHITKVIGDKDHPISQGYVCEKAQRMDYYQNGADRLTSPMRRMPNGEYEAVDWDTAIREVAQRLQAVKEQYGSERFIYYGGGGQGNHLAGAFGDSTLKALGVKYRSNALAQEKTGEFWVAGKMLGAGSHGDFEHCQVAVFIGKNPWQSHGFARSRAVIGDIVRDPERSMIVIDPRVSETAAKADIHLQIKPGTDAWCLGAMIGIIAQEQLVADAWVREHTTGYADIEPALQAIPIAEYAKVCGVPLETLRTAAELVANADSASFFEDLGMQMSVHSTLCSYLQRLIWLTTGHYGREGTSNAFVSFLSLAAASKGEGPTKQKLEKLSPVAKAKIIIGLVPCNVIPEEILADHPQSYKVMIIESGNPVHSLADSQAMRKALRALEFSVVIDVAMTETARQADYVLPACSQFEKAEATFFNIEFPRNAFHLRQPLFEPKAGTLPEAEIHARLLEAMGILTNKDYRALKAAAKLGLSVFTAVFFAKAATNPKIMKYSAIVLYRTLGPTLPKGMEQGALAWGLALMYVKNNPVQAKRAGFGGPLPLAANKLFKAIISSPSGVVFGESNHAESWQAIGMADHKINLHVPEMIKTLGDIGLRLPDEDEEYPFVLSAGERRTETSNTAVRDAGWHKKGVYGALRISVQDAAALTCETGDRLRLSTRRHSADVIVEVSDMMQQGHVSLPNGTGLHYTNEEGDVVQEGVAPNEFSDFKRRDFLAGTPWHKHIPAKLEKVS